MTYIKPETALNPSLSSVRAILHLGTKAAQREDWLTLSNYLKQLPQKQNGNKTQEFDLNKDDWNTALNLALSILIKADFTHKWSITKLLPCFGEEIIPISIALVRDETVEADVRWFVCQTLGNFSQPEVVFALVELLDSTTEKELIAIAAKTLTRIGDYAIDALQKLLTQPQHRVLAVQSLYYIRTAKTIEPLLEIAENYNSELKAIAIEALGSFHDCRIPPILIKALQDKASDVRQKAAIALGFRADLADELELVKHLSPLLFDFNLEVCRQAAISLSRMKDKTATAAIFEVLQSDITPVKLKLDLVKALGWSEIDSSIDYLAKTFSYSVPEVTVEIITVLGRTNKAELKFQAARTLVDYWNSNSSQLELSQIKQSLATSLGELRQECGRKILEQLRQDSDRKVKLYAVSALKKISFN